jgi:alanyl-tRNA synthetase
MKGSEVRDKFLKYFEEKGHTIIKSSSLVPPGDDPSLLFTNAGMNQFKPVFLGSETRPYNRAASAQKCVRAGGKHNDLENVGYTARHHTFFEMLGNFSFGDYFKEGAIAYAWDLLINVYELDASRLIVSVHNTDDEAYGIWRDKIGVPEERIVRLGDKDNFWSMGDLGPCGPCSEILYDQGPTVGCGRPECNVECDCDRFLEIWNLVFMQYNRDADGVMTPLPKPSIDTGMGLERITAILQGVPSNYMTDLFMPIIGFASTLAGREYGSDQEMDTSIRVIADHARACAFLICDGILPSNEGRGYVLRRIIRRASRHGRFLGIEGAFLHKVAMKVVEEFGKTYPDLAQRRDFIDKVITNEEERFLVTLDKGLALLSDSMTGLKPGDFIDGSTVFKLYDTFGFPVDLTEDIARRKGFGIDRDGFEVQMEMQREKARAGSSFADAGAGKNIFGAMEKTLFSGYEALIEDSTVTLILSPEDMEPLETLSAGQTGFLITGKTPFYGESGGQVGDTGIIENEGFEAAVIDTLKKDNVFLHKVKVIKGSINSGAGIRLVVDSARRKAIARHHSATHLLQKAIRDVLGTHAHQSGSYVSEERLRFDFTHFAALGNDEIKRIEDIVNGFVMADLPVCTNLMAREDAMSKGAMALFTEKYADEVRVVSMGEDVSVELCGGTHVKTTGEIGLVKIVSESSVSAGLRRIEAFAGFAALGHLRELDSLVKNSADALKCAPADIPDRIALLQSRLKEQDTKIKELNVKIATGTGAGDEEELSIGAFRAVIKRISAGDISQLREVGDRIKERIKSGVVFLAASTGDKSTFMIMLTNDLSGKLDAGAIMKTILAEVGGRGGGKALFAQGGADADKIDKAIDVFKTALKGA